MTETDLLRGLLLLSLALAPLATHRFFLPPTRLSTTAHVLAFLCAAIGLFSAPALCGVWLLYCAGSFAHYLWRHRTSLASLNVLVGCIPFVFSNIAALWLVGGANDLGILGYGPTFSFYASAHGNVLGWMSVGSIAMLAAQERPHQKLYVTTALLCFASFLLVAVGIDGVSGAKRVGVVGLSVAIPVAQLVFLRSVWKSHRGAFALACASFVGLVFTFVLAWQYELGALSFPAFAGIRPMVALHGVVNGVVVAPCFLLAVALETRRYREASALLESR